MAKIDNLQETTLATILDTPDIGYDGSEYFESLNKFPAVFYDKKMYLGNQEESVPLGTYSTEAINFIMTYKMKDLQPLIRQLFNTFDEIFIGKKKPLDLDSAQSLESKLREVDTHLECLSPFKDRLYKDHPLGFEITEKSLKDLGNKELVSDTILAYIEVSDALITFYKQIYDFSKKWITEGSKHNKESYTDAFEDYFYGGYFEINTLKKGATIFSSSLSQFLNIKSTFAPTEIPEYEEPIFSEVILFDNYIDLLQYDYFRALQVNHTVRVCRNCKRAFLNTTKHHTVYCDRIAPNETTKTCRKVGALNHQKEKAINSPIHQLYYKCYKKLNQRYNRGTISLDEFNDLIGEILQLRDDALEGTISVELLIEELNRI